MMKRIREKEDGRTCRCQLAVKSEFQSAVLSVLTLIPVIAVTIIIGVIVVPSVRSG